MHECIFVINEYYSFIHAWFIHKFLRENILVIHSSCAWFIHLFTIGGNAYSQPNKEEGRERINQSVCQSADSNFRTGWKEMETNELTFAKDICKDEVM
jgi:hypothetical protein